LTQSSAIDVSRAVGASVSSLLFSAYRVMEARIFGALAQSGFGDVTPAQGRVFRVIRAEGSRLTDIAHAAHVTKQTAGFLIDQLIRAGYVERTPDPADARARLIKIAPKGEAVIPVGAAVIANVEAEWAAMLGQERIDQLRETLRMLREATESGRDVGRTTAAGGGLTPPHADLAHAADLEPLDFGESADFRAIEPIEPVRAGRAAGEDRGHVGRPAEVRVR